MQNKIKQAQDLFKIEGYKKKAMPEVLEYLKRAKERKNGDTVYNAELTSEIMEKENLSEEYRDYVNTEVYLAQHDYRAEQEQKYTNNMLAQGWKVLDNEIEYTGKCKYIATKSLDWYTAKLENTGTLKRIDDGEELFLIPKGKRSRGYYVRNLEKAFYQELN